MIFSSLITRTNREEQRVAVALLSSPLPSWWSIIWRHFSSFAFSLSSRCDKYHRLNPGGRLDGARVTSAMLSAPLQHNRCCPRQGLLTSPLPLRQLVRTSLLVLRCVRCDQDAEVCLFIAFICRVEFPFCNKSHVLFLVFLFVFF